MAFSLISSLVLGLLNCRCFDSCIADKIVRAFNRSGATRVVARDISKAFDRDWYAFLLHKLKSYGNSR